MFIHVLSRMSTLVDFFLQKWGLILAPAEFQILLALI